MAEFVYPVTVNKMAALEIVVLPIRVAVKSVNVQDPLTIGWMVEPPKIQVAGELLTVAVTSILE